MQLPFVLDSGELQLKRIIECTLLISLFYRIVCTYTIRKISMRCPEPIRPQLISFSNRKRIPCVRPLLTVGHLHFYIHNFIWTDGLKKETIKFNCFSLHDYVRCKYCSGSFGFTV